MSLFSDSGSDHDQLEVTFPCMFNTQLCQNEHGTTSRMRELVQISHDDGDKTTSKPSAGKAKPVSGFDVTLLFPMLLAYLPKY